MTETQPSPLKDEFMSVILQGDRPGARNLVRRYLESGVSISYLYTDLIPTALYEAGEGWSRGEVSVAQEHLATATTEYILTLLYGTLLELTPTDLAGTVVLACVEKELHDLGLRLLSDHLEARGARVLYLGPATPSPQLVRFLQETHPRAVGLSCTMAHHLPRLRSLTAVLARVAPEMPVVVGGQALNRNPESVRELHCSGWGRSLPEGLELMAHWLQ